MSASSVTPPTHNERIAILHNTLQEYSIETGVWNIGNADRDEKNRPLRDRLPGIAEQINKVKENLSLFFLLEAGRPSKGKSWTSMAAYIQKHTGFQYHSCHTLNATPMAFGKALFFNPEKVAIHHVDQIWLDPKDPAVWGGPYFGNSIVRAHVHPVIDQKVVLDAKIRIAAVHFPMALKDRLEAAQWVSDHHLLADVWAGDFNTFDDDGGPQMIKIITEHAFEEITPQDAISFLAFEHDTIVKSVDIIPTLNSLSSYTHHPEDPTKILVRFASLLDRVFVDPRFDCVATVCPLTDASDHALVIVKIKFCNV